MPTPLRKPTPAEHLPPGSIDQLNLWAEMDRLVKEWGEEARLLHDTEVRHLRAEAKVIRRLAGQVGAITKRYDEQYQEESRQYDRRMRREAR